MAICKECKPVIQPWCYLDNNTLMTGTYSHDCKDNKPSNITYRNAQGDIVKEEDYVHADCPDCTNAQPVHICNAQPTAMLAPPACFKNADGKAVLLQPVVKEIGGNLITVGYVDEHGAVYSDDVKPTSSCDCKCEDCSNPSVPCGSGDNCFILQGFLTNKAKYECPNVGEAQSPLKPTVHIDGTQVGILSYKICDVSDGKYESSWYSPLIQAMIDSGLVKVTLQKDVYLQTDKDTPNWYYGARMVQYFVEIINPCKSFELKVAVNGNSWAIGVDKSMKSYTHITRTKDDPIVATFDPVKDCKFVLEDPEPLYEAQESAKEAS